MIGLFVSFFFYYSDISVLFSSFLLFFVTVCITGFQFYFFVLIPSHTNISGMYKDVKKSFENVDITIKNKLGGSKVQSLIVFLVIKRPGVRLYRGLSLFLISLFVHVSIFHLISFFSCPFCRCWWAIFYLLSIWTYHTFKCFRFFLLTQFPYDCPLRYYEKSLTGGNISGIFLIAKFEQLSWSILRTYLYFIFISLTISGQAYQEIIPVEGVDKHKFIIIDLTIISLLVILVKGQSCWRLDYSVNERN